MLPPELDDILKRCKEALQNLYGDRFAGLVLYGSIARGDYNPESDIDLIVLLRGRVDPYAEIRPIVHALYRIQLESGRLISARAISARDYRSGDRVFLHNVRRDAVPV